MKQTNFIDCKQEKSKDVKANEFQNKVYSTDTLGKHCLYICLDLIEFGGKAWSEENFKRSCFGQVNA